MYAFNLKAEQTFDPKKHMEKVLGATGEGDVTIACWEPGQTSPYHCHPDATEIYFCYQGGGKMRTPTRTIAARTVCTSGRSEEFTPNSALLLTSIVSMSAETRRPVP